MYIVSPMLYVCRSVLMYPVRGGGGGSAKTGFRSGHTARAKVSKARMVLIPNAVQYGLAVRSIFEFGSVTLC